MNKLVCSAALVALMGTTAIAQTAQPELPEFDTVVLAGQLLDIPGQEPRGNTSILISGDKIVGMADGFITQTGEAVVVDLREQFVLPGFMDAHVHTGDDPYEALKNANLYLQAGFTTVRELGANGGVSVALRNAIRDGVVNGPRMQVVGNAITSSYGHGDPRQNTWGGVVEHNHDHHLFDLSGICDGPEDCRRATREQLALGVDAIKITATGLTSRPTGVETGAIMTLEEMTAIVETAHQRNVPVTAHAHGGIGLRWALEAGVDSIEHGNMINSIEGDVQALADSGVYYVPTLATGDMYRDILANPESTPDEITRANTALAVKGPQVRAAHEAGVPIVLGTDAGISYHGRNASEFEWYVDFGLTPMEAIVAGTVNAATHMRVIDVSGTLEVGKYADIVGVTGNPLEDITILQDVDFVMLGGETVRNDLAQ